MLTSELEKSTGLYQLMKRMGEDGTGHEGSGARDECCGQDTKEEEI